METVNTNNLELKCPDCASLLTLNLNPNNQISVWDSSKKRRRSIIDRINLSMFQSSTKMEALMEVDIIYNGYNIIHRSFIKCNKSIWGQKQ